MSLQISFTIAVLTSLSLASVHLVLVFECIHLLLGIYIWVILLARIQSQLRRLIDAHIGSIKQVLQACDSGHSTCLSRSHDSSHPCVMLHFNLGCNSKLAHCIIWSL